MRPQKTAVIPNTLSKINLIKSLQEAGDKAVFIILETVLSY
jgi:hypothetical protein